MKNFTKIALTGLVILAFASTQEMFGKCSGGSCSRKKARVAKTVVVTKSTQKVAVIAKAAGARVCTNGVCSRR